MSTDENSTFMSFRHEDMKEDLDENELNYALARSSTPYPDDSHKEEINPNTYEGMAYEIFLERMILRRKFAKRGLSGTHPAIRTCNLLKFKDNKHVPQTSYDLVESGASNASMKLFRFRRVVTNAFRKIFSKGDRCNVKTCPIICECRLNDSLLNQRISTEEGSDEDNENIPKTEKKTQNVD